MVPGGTGDALFFAALMAELRGWRMIALNRPGGGLSDGLDHRQVDIRHLAVHTLQSVADAFELGSVPVLRNSMGGLWSPLYALANPGRASRIVQMGCPALILDTSAPFFMRLLGVPGVNRLIAPNMQPKNIETALGGLRFQGSSQEDIDRMARELAEAAYCFFHLPTYLPTWMTLISAVTTLTGASRRYHLRAEHLTQVQQHVLFVWGEKDPFGNLEVARREARIVPNARLHEKRTGHLPFLDQPKECGRVIRDFLSAEGNDAAPFA